ncbi:MAG: cytochrome c [Proteobacteria bacterium]|nr:cytochrome c [Pseudomonadota bacterium]
MDARLSRRAPLALTVMILSVGVAAFAVGATRDDPAIVRGAEVAHAHCANCHAVALEDRSPEKDAPQFRVLSRLYDQPVLADKIARFSQDGHFEMPPVTLREDEVADVAAYIASLDGGSLDIPRRHGDPVAMRSSRPTAAERAS